jgi:hypothetical protein
MVYLRRDSNSTYKWKEREILLKKKKTKQNPYEEGYSISLSTKILMLLLSMVRGKKKEKKKPPLIIIADIFQSRSDWWFSSALVLK